ncbi:MAG TPA: hypothetical protein VFE52_06215 [Devosia sp.]|jgi:hypothetical protein|nr:hypothetical protein [Devosia sp.]
MERSYISDPALLAELEGTPQGAPQAESGRSYISDPALLAQLDGAEATAPGADQAIPVGPFGNSVQAGVTSALNTGTLNLYRNAQAAATYGLGKLGVPGFPDMPFETHYQKWKAYDDEINRQNPKSAIAGTVAGGVGAALAAPAILPEASMAALYSGGAGALARSGAIGAGLAGVSGLADTHDLGKAATSAAIGAVAGPVADKAAHMVRPFVTKADALVPREIEAIVGNVVPGTPAHARARLGNAVGQTVGAGVGGAAGGAVGMGIGGALGEYWPYAGGITGAGAGAEAGRRVMAGAQRDRTLMNRQGLYYPKTNAGAVMMGATVPQALYGLLGGGEGR